MPYLDVEALLTGWLPSVVTCRVVTELPADLLGAVPLVRVARVGGTDPQPSVDDATVDVEAFHTGRDTASALAEQVRSALRFQLPGHAGGTGNVAHVQTVAAPAWRPFDDTNVRRFGAMYQITVHTPSA